MSSQWWRSWCWSKDYPSQVRSQTRIPIRTRAAGLAPSSQSPRAASSPSSKAASPALSSPIIPALSSPIVPGVYSTKYYFCLSLSLSRSRSISLTLTLTQSLSYRGKVKQVKEVIFLENYLSTSEASSIGSDRAKFLEGLPSWSGIDYRFPTGLRFILFYLIIALLTSTFTPPLNQHTTNHLLTR